MGAEVKVDERRPTGDSLEPWHVCRLGELSDTEVSRWRNRIAAAKAASQAVINKYCLTGLDLVYLVDDLALLGRTMSAAKPGLDMNSLTGNIPDQLLTPFTQASFSDTGHLGETVKSHSTYSEAALEQRARDLRKLILEKAQDNPAVKLENDRIQISTNYGKYSVCLTGVKAIDDPTYPSCSLLDLAWVESRVKSYRRSFSILPTEFLLQQKGVAALAALIMLERRTNFTTVIFDQAGALTHEINFGDFSVQ